MISEAPGGSGGGGSGAKRENGHGAIRLAAETDTDEGLLPQAHGDAGVAGEGRSDNPQPSRCSA
jgi:hypothetical protein